MLEAVMKNKGTKMENKRSICESKIFIQQRNTTNKSISESKNPSNREI